MITCLSWIAPNSPRLGKDLNFISNSLEEAYAPAENDVTKRYAPELLRELRETVDPPVNRTPSNDVPPNLCYFSPDGQFPFRYVVQEIATMWHKLTNCCWIQYKIFSKTFV